ncbi:hypothetical protein SISSUDRAFT_1038138 [Sistotremastrum suecicum HHB10207 ss-3]|uniref:Uncharacterized protein n=1 Tax=Sistotremastrum suecicum HHB10207 ss-3 TaxID=1314776 RepID=A0A165X639_9AGAM|nr:hypothetical protein SISSUDRAFT_1038138 [Sistotremastrum suecicum HHB10207 ss-3]
MLQQFYATQSAAARVQDAASRMQLLLEQSRESLLPGASYGEGSGGTYLQYSGNQEEVEQPHHFGDSNVNRGISNHNKGIVLEKGLDETVDGGVSGSDGRSADEDADRSGSVGSGDSGNDTDDAPAVLPGHNHMDNILTQWRRDARRANLYAYRVWTARSIEIAHRHLPLVLELGEDGMSSDSSDREGRRTVYRIHKPPTPRPRGVSDILYWLDEVAFHSQNGFADRPMHRRPLPKRRAYGRP